MSESTSSAREFAERIRDIGFFETVEQIETRDAKLQNEARALAIREAGALMENFAHAHLTQLPIDERDALNCKQYAKAILALLSTTHADAQAAHDKRVRLKELLNVEKVFMYHDGVPNLRLYLTREIAELRAEPPSKSGEGRP
jgi:hypothetical protein